MLADIMTSSLVVGPNILSHDVSTNGQSVFIDGIAFPSSISKQTLIGGGTRFKWGFKVYGVGIYGEEKTVQKMKKQYTTEIPPALFEDFSQSKAAKTLLLRFHRAVASSDVAEALGEALKPKVGKQTSDAFETFILNMIGGDILAKGSDIFIACKGEKVTASLTGGNASSSMNVKGLCPAIFMVYLGDNPVSQQAKEGFAKGFSSR